MKTSKLLEARENANDHAVDVLSLASDWLVVTRVSKTNDGAKKCETKIFRITVDIQLETAAVYRIEEWMQFCSPPF